MKFKIVYNEIDEKYRCMEMKEHCGADVPNVPMTGAYFGGYETYEEAEEEMNRLIEENGLDKEDWI